MVGEVRFPSGVAKMCWHTFRSKREHRSTLERVTSEPRLGSPAWFELDQARAQSEVLGKIKSIRFPKPDGSVWQIRHSPAVHAADGDRANLHPSGVWATEAKDSG
jgi:hypothetical protein